MRQSTVIATGIIGSVSLAITNGERMLKEEVDKMINDTFSSLHTALDNCCRSLLVDVEEMTKKKRGIVNCRLEEFYKIKESFSS